MDFHAGIRSKKEVAEKMYFFLQIKSRIRTIAQAATLKEKKGMENGTRTRNGKLENKKGAELQA